MVGVEYRSFTVSMEMFVSLITVPAGEERQRPDSPFNIFITLHQENPPDVS